MPPSVLIIAPHSHCEATTYRDCDSVAGQAVKELRSADRQGIIAQEHLSDRLRALGDYNRPVTDATPWREQSRAIASTIAPDFVLEVHSFPGNHVTFRSAWPGADLVLFESPANAQWIGHLADEVRKRAPEFKVMTAVPWHPCAISDDMAKLGLRHTLVEFNEDMPRSRIGPLAKAVVESLTQFLAPSPAGQPIAGGGSLLPKETALLSTGSAILSKNKWAIALLVALVILIIAYASSMNLMPNFSNGRWAIAYSWYNAR